MVFILFTLFTERKKVSDRDVVLVDRAHACVLRRRADTGAFASGHSAATTDKPFNQLLSVQS